MLIRSQDKKNLYNFDCIQHINATENGAVRLSSIDLHETIGIYSTEEKAIKVLDKIQKKYEECLKVYSYSSTSALYDFPKVFQMPEDSEV